MAIVKLDAKKMKNGREAHKLWSEVGALSAGDGKAVDFGKTDRGMVSHGVFAINAYTGLKYKTTAVEGRVLVYRDS